MYVIREVLNCKPGQVRQMVEKFRQISIVLKEMSMVYLKCEFIGQSSMTPVIR